MTSRVSFLPLEAGAQTVQAASTRPECSMAEPRRALLTRLMLLALLSAGAAAWPGPARADEASTAPIPSLYDEAAPFLKAIGGEAQPAPAERFRVTGITVPHHLLAADLIARGFQTLQGNRYDRVVVLSPDHFKRTRRPFATTSRHFETVLGRVASDREAVKRLLANPMFEESDLFGREHGIGALLPFIRHFAPDVPVVAVVVSPSAGQAEWEHAVDMLLDLVGPDTLVVQSTDYSHYLPLPASIQRDQESLNVIASARPEAVAGLVASDHLDSKGSQYIQMRLQERRGNRATVIANRNSVEYVPSASRTTSYVVSVYGPQVEAFPYSYPDQEVVVFGGDAFPGRFLTPLLADEDIAARIVERVRALTGGARMVLNLEGVLLREVPEGLNENLHAIHAGLGLPILKALNVGAAGLANNHSFDLGRSGYGLSLASLREAGIAPLEHGRVVDLGPARIVALNFVGRHDPHRLSRLDNARPRGAVRYPRPAAALCLRALGARNTWASSGRTRRRSRASCAAAGWERSSAATTTWGRTRSKRRRAATTSGSPRSEISSSTRPRRAGSGTLVEVRFFRQGTFAMRLLPLPNLFDLGNAMWRARPALTGPPGPPGSARNR